MVSFPPNSHGPYLFNRYLTFLGCKHVSPGGTRMRRSRTRGSDHAICRDPENQALKSAFCLLHRLLLKLLHRPLLKLMIHADDQVRLKRPHESVLTSHILSTPDSTPGFEILPESFDGANNSPVIAPRDSLPLPQARPRTLQRRRSSIFPPDSARASTSRDASCPPLAHTPSTSHTPPQAPHPRRTPRTTRARSAGRLGYRPSSSDETTRRDPVIEQYQREVALAEFGLRKRRAQTPVGEAPVLRRKRARTMTLAD